MMFSPADKPKRHFYKKHEGLILKNKAHNCKVDLFLLLFARIDKTIGLQAFSLHVPPHRAAFFVCRRFVEFNQET
jgi:hypothetical protein